MKRFLSLLTLATLFAAGVSAQNNIYHAVAGPHYNAAGELVISDPSTTINIELTVVKEQTIVGPYAKYAQKFLEVRPALVERTTYSVTNASLAVVTKAKKSKSNAKQKVEVESYMGSATEFAKVSPDRTSSSSLSLEDAAQQAALAIFSIRKHRMELITGEAGENVFGGGLKDALKALDEKEQEYLELFLGKKVTTTTTQTFTVHLAAGVQEYAFARFDKQSGVSAAAAKDCNIKLSVTPSEAEPKFNAISEADPRDKSAIAVRLANMAICSVVANNAAIGSAQLPVFEFGRTAYISAPVKK